VHTLESIQQCSPEAVHAPKNHQLRTGAVSCASDLMAAFSDDDSSNTKLDLIKRIASEITCEEFKDECKKAQTLADVLDSVNGFVPSDDARYGIKRRVLNNRLSEAKRLFGVFKAAPDVLKEKGYNPAVVAARQWLLQNRKQWDGVSVPDEQSREAKAVSKATKEVTSSTPMVPGESIKDYQARCLPLIECYMAEAKQKAYEDSIDKLVKRLAENEDGDVLLTACLRILESQSISDVQGYIEYLSEAKMIAQHDQGTEA
jgi:hypothetical protein